MQFSLFILLWISPQMPNAVDAVEIVKHSTLSINGDKTVGKAFATYRWFATGQWDRSHRDDGRTLVTFRGEWPDPPAAKDFHERFRYSVKMSLMAMQMNTLYKLDKDKDRLAFIVDFLVEKDDTFAVVSGRLGIRNQSDQTWRYVDLSNKALLRIIEALYSDQNPYVALCQGLPFK